MSGRFTALRHIMGALTLASLFSLAACGGGSNGSTNNNSPAGIPAPTGGTPAPGTPTPSGGTPPPGGTGTGGGSSVPPSTFVFVAAGGPNIDMPGGMIEVFKVDPNSGALTAISGSPFQTGHTNSNITVNQNCAFTGSLDFINQNFTNILTAYSIDANSGAISAKQSFSMGPGIKLSPTLAANGRTLYVSVAGNAQAPSGIATFAVNSDCTLNQVGQLATTDINPNEIAIDQAGRFLFVGSSATNNVWGFRIDSSSGVLKPITGIPLTIQRQLPQAGKEPTPLTVRLDPAGQRLFVVDNINATILTYSVDQSSGALTALSGTTTTPFGEAFSPAMDPRGRFLYIGAFNTNEVAGFSITPNGTGTFAAVPGSPVTSFGAPVRYTVVDRSGKFMYATDDAGRLNIYSIDQGTGALTAGKPVAVQGFPGEIAVTP